MIYYYETERCILGLGGIGLGIRVRGDWVSVIFFITDG